MRTFFRDFEFQILDKNIFDWVYVYFFMFFFLIFSFNKTHTCFHSTITSHIAMRIFLWVPHKCFCRIFLADNQTFVIHQFSPVCKLFKFIDFTFKYKILCFCDIDHNTNGLWSHQRKAKKNFIPIELITAAKTTVTYKNHAS